MMQKTILLIAPHRFGFTKMFVQNLEYHGYRVINIGYATDGFEYKSWKDRIWNACRKVIFKDKQFKKKLLFEQHQEKVLNKLRNLKGKADYGLVIRSDLYAMQLIDLVKQNAHKMIGYQWDGIDRYPEILDHIPLYDKFYVFDANDASKYSELGVQSINNFYFDFDKVNSAKLYDKTFFFIGTHQSERVEHMNIVVQELMEQDYHPKVVIYTDKKIDESQYLFPVEIIDEIMSYREALEWVKKSGILLDFKNNVHNGLSFRIFESLRYSKKIITDNESVLSYPFYHPNNMYVLGKSAYDLKEFLNKDYQPIDPNIVQSFGFKHWIEKLLN